MQLLVYLRRFLHLIIGKLWCRAIYIWVIPCQINALKEKKIHHHHRFWWNLVCWLNTQKKLTRIFKNIFWPTRFEIWVVQFWPKRSDLQWSNACISGSMAPRKMIYSSFERSLKALSYWSTTLVNATTRSNFKTVFKHFDLDLHGFPTF